MVLVISMIKLTCPKIFDIFHQRVPYLNVGNAFFKIVWLSWQIRLITVLISPQKDQVGKSKERVFLEGNSCSPCEHQWMLNLDSRYRWSSIFFCT